MVNKIIIKKKKFLSGASLLGNILVGSLLIIGVSLIILLGIGAYVTYMDEPPQYSSNPVLNTQLVELWKDIEADKTDENKYVPGSYVCKDFAKDLDANLDKQGWESYEVWVYPKDGTTFAYFGDKQSSNPHALVKVNIYDENGKRYTILVDPQSDENVFKRYDVNGDGVITMYPESEKRHFDSEWLYGHEGHETSEGNLFIIYGESED